MAESLSQPLVEDRPVLEMHMSYVTYNARWETRHVNPLGDSQRHFIEETELDNTIATAVQDAL